MHNGFFRVSGAFENAVTSVSLVQVVQTPYTLAPNRRARSCSK